MTRRERNEKRFARYIRRTLKNKLTSLAFVGIGLATLPVCDGDVTALVAMLFVAVCLFFAKEDVY